MEELIDGTGVGPVHVVAVPEAIQGANMLERLNSTDTVRVGRCHSAERGLDAYRAYDTHPRRGQAALDRAAHGAVVQ